MSTFIINTLKMYFTIEGRIGVSDVVYYGLIPPFVTAALLYILTTTGLIIPQPIYLLIGLIFSIGCTCVFTKRLHDAGVSGTYLFIALTVIGLLPVLYELFLEGKSCANNYGPVIGCRIND